MARRRLRVSVWTEQEGMIELAPPKQGTRCEHCSEQAVGWHSDATGVISRCEAHLFERRLEENE